MTTSFVCKSQATEHFLKQIQNNCDDVTAPSVNVDFEMPQKIDESDVFDDFELPIFDQSNPVISNELATQSDTTPINSEQSNNGLTQNDQSDSCFTSPPTLKNDISSDETTPSVGNLEKNKSKIDLCVKCGVLVQQKELTNHYRRNPSCTPYEKRNEKLCDQCGLVFNETWENHYKYNTECLKKGYQCNVCKIWLVNLNKLTSHMYARHFNDTPYQCHLCSNMFKYENNLKRHLKVHEQGKIFKCEFCDKGLYSLYKWAFINSILTV